MPDSLGPASRLALHTAATVNAVLSHNTFPVHINTPLHLFTAVTRALGMCTIRSLTQGACSKIMYPAAAHLLYNNCPVLPSLGYKARWGFV